MAKSSFFTVACVTLAFVSQTSQAVAMGNPFDDVIDNLQLEAIAADVDESEGEPRYVVRVTKFYCGDESGNDSFGSDEPYWIFTARSLSGTPLSGTPQTFRSEEFGDIDSGNTREFKEEQSIIWPEYGGAEGAHAPIELFIQLWEADVGGEPDKAVRYTKLAFEAAKLVPKYGEFVKQAPDIFENEIAKAIGDNFMGQQTISYSTDQLASQLPQVGDRFEEDFHFYNGPDYDLFIEVTRVQ